MQKLIAIEGIDGSGKTTLANLLKEHLESKMKLNVIVTREPFSEDIIKLIEKIGWNDPILLVLLFAADREIHVNWLSKIKDADLIILDRYYFSSIAYQGALGVDEQWIKMVNSYFPKPDMVILLDLPIEVAISRIKNDKFNFEEKIKSLAKVREKYLKLAKEYNFYIVDASKDKNEVLEQAIKIIQKNLF
ncbi:dTMP kinase [Saccharolobus islandicus]|uniref:Probable thymidylate kinase n=6 Tax=Saccharolobus islandicus TaxID=43080 RepID=M9U972_SACIS|nr:dTMP kinase [Sulfolobus islandicus]ACP38114.1 dTMP kinase [Sulfolobus islandicus M.14.25]ACP55293.1 dTMP kinase [Sulfolobus islandicus M.16.27]ACR41958.1 dTMP kinase [Sulfolobus islandicus M.16.4]ADX82654.1 dTMP kinase [Sulfolobus islandicus HVE10/4]ADX85288.1 dTMP kinase [Sulfolobus islandicus REY15A]